MSSVLKAYAQIQKTPTKFFAMITPSYEDDTFDTSGVNVNLPIPFTVVNQVLDINVNQSSEIQAFVINGNEPIDQSGIQARALGGTSLVKSFGPNMITYLRNWIANVEGAAYTGPLVLYIRPVMTKVQTPPPAFATNDAPFQSNESWGITTQAPVSEDYIGGGPTNNYLTAWVFKTPMTIQYEAASGYKYITMTTQFSEE